MVRRWRSRLGAQYFTIADCFIWENGSYNVETTMQFLHQLHRRFTGDTHKIVIIRDGASYPRCRKVRAFADRLGFTILPLPAYSHEFNPRPEGTRGAWKWMSEEVTQHYCHATLDELRHSCLAFIASLNRIPEQVVTRLWPHFDLDSDLEKLRLSF